MRISTLLLYALPLVSALPQVGERPSANFFYKGHDLSSLLMLEESGEYIYKDTERGNETRTADAILGDGGMNSVRLR